MPAPVEPDAEIEAVLRSLLDRLFLLMLTLGVSAMAATTLRALHTGFTVSYAGDIVAFLVVLGALLARKRVPPRWAFGGVLAGFTVTGVVSLATLGLASASMMILTATCILAGVFARLRTAVMAVLALFVLMAVVGFLRARGLLPYLPNVAGFLAAPSSWATQGMVFLAFVLAAVFAVDNVKRRLTRSLEALGQRGTELERVARRLRERERQYRLLADNITDMVFVQGLDLGITYLSKSAETIFGRTVDEVCRLGMASIMTEDSFLRAQEIYGQYLPRAQRGEAVEPPLMQFEYLRADGSTFWGELRVKFLRDASGALVGSQGTLRDISERRRGEQERQALEQRLREGEKLRAIGQLAGGVAHDFNNQLTAMMGFAQLIAADTGASPSVRGHAQNILIAARTSADLTGKLLAFSRRTGPGTDAVDAHVLIGEVVAMLEPTVGKHIRIETKLRAPASLLQGDRSQLVSALMNLGLNARDAMPDGGSMTFVTDVVDAGTDGRWLEVTVSDTGVGMDSDTVQHAFEPFFTRKGPGKGTGLGLAVVYGTVQSHGGSIDIQSSPGQGTSLRMRLPLVDAVPESVGTAPAESVIPVGRSASIMVVDDEELVGRATGLALESAGHRVSLFRSPAEALRHYREHWRAVDLAVVDVVMPEMSGQALLGELRAINREVAAVLVSGHLPETSVPQLLQLGARGFLAKPFTPSELCASVWRALER